MLLHFPGTQKDGFGCLASAVLGLSSGALLDVGGEEIIEFLCYLGTLSEP
jgi:hypothetical protein